MVGHDDPVRPDPGGGTRILGIETVMFSCSTADEDFHAPNEHIRLSGLADGVAGWRDVLERLGRAPWPG